MALIFYKCFKKFWYRRSLTIKTPLKSQASIIDNHYSQSTC